MKYTRSIMITLALASAATANTHGVLHEMHKEKPHHDLHETKGGTDEHESWRVLEDLYFSLTGDISYVASSLKQSEKERLFIPYLTEAHGAGGHTHGHTHALHSKNGFNFNYFEAELLYRPYEGMSFFVNLHNSGHGFEIEEMYVSKHDLIIDNLDIKAGKFYSNFGIISAKHANMWEFANMPVAYLALLGGERLLDTGIQLRFYPYHESPLSFGAEIYQGDGEKFGLSDNSDAPNVFTGFVKYADNFDDIRIQSGIAYIQGDANIHHQHGAGDAHKLTGENKYYAANLSIEKMISQHASLTWQSEYIRRELTGTRIQTGQADRPVESSADGFYTQLVYKDDALSYGLRYDGVLNNKKRVGGVAKPEYDIKKYTAMVSYELNDFSKLRLEMSRDETRYEKEGSAFVPKESNDIILQYIFSFGKEPSGGHAH